MKNILKQILEEYGNNHYYYGIKKYDLESKLKEETKFLGDNVKNKERVYCVLNDMTEIPVCKLKSCKNKPKFKNISVGYHDFCSSKCSEQYKRETTDENGVLLTEIIGKKISENKKTLMSNGKTKGQNARKKQLIEQNKIDPKTGLKGTVLVAKKGVKTLKSKGELKQRGQKIKNVKLTNVDDTGKNGYERAAEAMSLTKKRQYQQLQIDNASKINNYYLYFFLNEEENLIKIGVSKNYVNRKKYFDRKLSCNLIIDEVFYGNQREMMRAEYRLHNILSEGQVKFSKIDGKFEWFDYSFFLENKCKIINELKKFNVENLNGQTTVI